MTLIRLTTRQGLIKARLRGAREAKGEVLYFTDAHTETNVGWLEPLLARIVEDRKVVVVPYVDPISWNDMKYKKVASDFHGAFDWNMEYFYKVIPPNVMNARKSITDPIPSPTMIGCAHAVEKKYFFESGSYDESMEIWGGENIEHSFRLWMCGGRVEVIPCSKIGHVFKPNLPYSFGEKSETVIQRNMIRLAEVWMDDYKKYYYATQDRLAPIDVASLIERKKLRKRLGCKSFSWYMKNIIPEMPIPPDDARWFGKIMRLKNFDYCIIEDFVSQRLKVVLCEPQIWKNLSFVITENGQFRFDKLCIGVSDKSSILNVGLECSSTMSTWGYSAKTHLVYNIETDLCLQYNPETKGIDLAKCWNRDPNQQWQFEVTLHFERQHNVMKNTVEHLEIPPKALRFGQLTNVQEQYCLHVLDLRKHEMVPCKDQPSYLHVIHLDTDKRLVFEDSCLTVSNGKQLVLNKCDQLNKSQELWDYNSNNLHLTAKMPDSSSSCLTFNPNVGNNIYLADCDNMDLYQAWTI